MTLAIWLTEATSDDHAVALLLDRMRAERELPPDFSCYGAVRTFVLSRYGPSACNLAPTIWVLFATWRMRQASEPAGMPLRDMRDDWTPAILAIALAAVAIAELAFAFIKVMAP